MPPVAEDVAEEDSLFWAWEIIDAMYAGCFCSFVSFCFLCFFLLPHDELELTQTVHCHRLSSLWNTPGIRRKIYVYISPRIGPSIIPRPSTPVSFPSWANNIKCASLARLVCAFIREWAFAIKVRLRGKETTICSGRSSVPGRYPLILACTRHNLFSRG